MKKTVVLVYSGGLDTSVCIPLMKEQYGYDHVVTVTVDVGQPAADIAQAAEKAKVLGTEHYTVDAKEEFARDYCFAALKANGDYQGYPISTSIARPLIGLKAAQVARDLGAKAFAHGCTGKGNDQFRIEYAIRAMIPDAEIHAPVRERNMTRSWEIEYAKSHGIPIQASLEKIWSIDENLWGRSIEGGRLEEPDYAPPSEIFQWTQDPQKAPDQAQEIAIQFANGVPVAINGAQLKPGALVAEANRIAGSHGVGRVDIMEDRMLGLKVRENYECPGATLLLRAHAALEALVLRAMSCGSRSSSTRSGARSRTRVSGSIRTRTTSKPSSARPRSASTVRLNCVCIRARSKSSAARRRGRCTRKSWRRSTPRPSISAIPPAW